MFDKAFVQELAKQLVPEIREMLADSEKPVTIAPRYMTFEQAAQYLGTTEAAIRGMARTKAFPIIKRAGRNHVDVKELDKAMQANTQWL